MTAHPTRRRGAPGASALAAARAFYCDALGGREMRPVRSGEGRGMLRFVVEGHCVATGPGAADDRVTLVVEDAAAIAERCWDAGFEVRVRGPADAGTFVVIDPFDLQIEVVSSGRHELAAARREALRA